jgi:protein involved in polysaccharide export with SLBB domain
MTKLPTSPAAIVAAAFLCAAIAGCNSNTERLKAFLQQPRSPVSGTEYRVLPPDVISVSSLRVPDINNLTQRIRPDGKINVPLIGEVYVADHTPKEIEELLKTAAREYYEQVDATVQVVGYNSQKIYVFGQVGRPGPIPWTGCDTLLDVLAQVQPTELAWPERIRVVRGKPPQQGGYLPPDKNKKKPDKAAAAPAEAPAEAQPAEGKPPEAKSAEAKPAEAKSPEAKSAEAKPAQAKPAGAVPPEEGGGQEEWQAEGKKAIMTVDMMKMVKKGDLSQNVLLKPNDIVYVPPNPLAAIGLAIQQVLFPIRPATETITTPASAATMMSGVP